MDTWEIVVIIGAALLIGKAFWRPLWRQLWRPLWRQLCRNNFIARWDSWLEIQAKEQIKERLVEWREWLKNLSGLKKTYLVLAIIASVIFITSLRFLFPEFLDKIEDRETTFYNLSLAFFAVLSGLGALLGFYISIIKTETAEQGLITDRINKAVEGLGRSNLKDEPIIEVRLGALYALERIAQDSIRDHIQIMELLCAYIRYNSPLKDRVLDETPLREDVQTALTIIGRRYNWFEGSKRRRIEKKDPHYFNLSHCDLYGAKLGGASLNNAIFDGSNLQNAQLNQTNLTNASFDNTILEDANFSYAKTTRACTQDGDFSRCKNLTQEQLEDMYCGIDVLIPSHLERSGAWPDKKLTDDKAFTDYLDWVWDRYGTDMLLM